MNTLVKVGLGVLALLVAGVLARELFPKTETLTLPGRTDTVTVTRTQMDTVVETQVRTRTVEVHDTDTVVLSDTVWQTAVETVAVLSPRWYLDTLVAGRERGDTAVYQTTFLAADSSGIMRRDAVERQVQLGPVRQVSMDAEGLHVEYGEPPRSGISLPFGLSVSPGLMCGAAGGAGLLGGLWLGG